MLKADIKEILSEMITRYIMHNDIETETYANKILHLVQDNILSNFNLERGINADT